LIKTSQNLYKFGLRCCVGFNMITHFKSCAQFKSLVHSSMQTPIFEGFGQMPSFGTLKVDFIVKFFYF